MNTNMRYSLATLALASSVAVAVPVPDGTSSTGGLGGILNLGSLLGGPSGLLSGIVGKLPVVGGLVGSTGLRDRDVGDIFDELGLSDLLDDADIGSILNRAGLSARTDSSGVLGLSDILGGITGGAGNGDLLSGLLGDLPIINNLGLRDVSDISDILSQYGINDLSDFLSNDEFSSLLSQYPSLDSFFEEPTVSKRQSLTDLLGSSSGSGPDVLSSLLGGGGDGVLGGLPIVGGLLSGLRERQVDDLLSGVGLSDILNNSDLENILSELGLSDNDVAEMKRDGLGNLLGSSGTSGLGGVLGGGASGGLLGGVTGGLPIVGGLLSGLGL